MCVCVGRAASRAGKAVGVSSCCPLWTCNMNLMAGLLDHLKSKPEFDWTLESSMGTSAGPLQNAVSFPLGPLVTLGNGPGRKRDSRLAAPAHHNASVHSNPDIQRSKGNPSGRASAAGQYLGQSPSLPTSTSAHSADQPSLRCF